MKILIKHIYLLLVLSSCVSADSKTQDFDSRYFLDFTFYNSKFFNKYRLRSWNILLNDKRVLTTSMSIEVKIYIDDILQIFKKNSINKNSVDWNLIEEELFNNAYGSVFASQSHSAINKALRRLDNHSYLCKTLENNIKVNQRTDNEIDYAFLDKNIAYLKLYPTVSTSFEYAQMTQKAIQSLDKKNPKHWAIDLRGNSGGNMWEMLLGLAPLLGEGVYGYFGVEESDFLAWKHANGKILIQEGKNEHLIGCLPNPYSLINVPQKIFVLIDSKTASSAEAVALAFKRKDNVTYFGSKSCGATTATASFELSDSSTLFLAVTNFFDVKKVKYPAGIYPDVKLSDTLNKVNDLDFLTNILKE